MNNEIKRELIVENFNNPVNKGLKNDPSYLKEEKKNSSCIDHFTIELKLNNNIIEDIRFDGEGCAVSTSSLSIAISKLIGKTRDEGLDIINNYNNMIEGKPFNKEKLEELSIYEDVGRQPARVKCATLGISRINDLLKK